MRRIFADKQLRLAVERAFEILGEALTQIRKISPETAEKISDYRAIISFRNVLIHGYSTVKHDITWDIVQTELPTLKREIVELLGA
ncbi:MAG TPA: HepT-like ribonuclease domain-containing protein [Phycisphaerae bacterium]|nr:HepT-like ribonuclease domain-containing protein [Phycisphaerae bacterium]